VEQSSCTRLRAHQFVENRSTRIRPRLFKIASSRWRPELRGGRFLTGRGFETRSLLHSGPQHRDCMPVAGSKTRRKNPRCVRSTRRKTGYVAQLMGNAGTIVACDRDPERLEILNENMARLGVKIGRVVRHDWTGNRVSQEIASVAPFDRILIDAPCTNTGVTRRRVDLRWRLQPTDFGRMQQRQIDILRAVIPLLKSNGALVYSTCSLEPEENEQVVGRILAEMAILCLEAQRGLLPFRDGFDGAYAARLTRLS